MRARYESMHIAQTKYEYFVDVSGKKVAQARRQWYMGFLFHARECVCVCFLYHALYISPIFFFFYFVCTWELCVRHFVAKFLYANIAAALRCVNDIVDLRKRKARNDTWRFKSNFNGKKKKFFAHSKAKNVRRNR